MRPDISVSFGLLGPLDVRVDAAEISLPPQLRTLLAALLIQAGQPVPARQLADWIWADARSHAAVTTLRSYIKRLRQALGPAAIRIKTRDGSYLISVADDELDLLRLTALVRTGEAALRGRFWQQAAGVLAQALQLWRGAPLADIPSDALRSAEAPRLEQLRLQALEWRIEADLQLGLADTVIPELQALVTEHPFREHLHGQLMLALSRSGRTAESLAAFRQARAVLVTELGIEPGAELQRLHHRILAGDELDPAACFGKPGSVAVACSANVPRQLPGQVRCFVGRERELATLTEALAKRTETGDGPLVCAISGMGGVGKTALAVRWAYQATGWFPDGQLYVNLRGYDPEQPMTPAAALAGFLRALGLPGKEIPAELDARATMFRSITADRKLLVLLDNAADAEQARPLLAAGPACAVILTSRDTLSGLVARDGARRLDLHVLPEPQAIDLLRGLIGARVDADPVAAQLLARRCSRLPLALRVAAELTAARPDDPLARMVTELASWQHRLDVLDAGGDRQTGIRSVLSWSYQQLNARAAAAFRLLAGHPGADVTAAEAAALLDTTPAQAGRILDQLRRAHLMHSAGPGRHTWHDLVRAYAAEQANARTSEQVRAAAGHRLLGYYVVTAGAAMDILFPAERDRRPRPAAGWSPDPEVSDVAAAAAWLDSSRANLVACAQVAAPRWPEEVTMLALTVHRYLDKGGFYAEAITLQRCAVGAARECGNLTAEAEALTNLGVVQGHQGHYRVAQRHFQRALFNLRTAGNLRGEARVRNNLAVLAFGQGRYTESRSHLEAARGLHQQAGDRAGEARALGNLGFLCQRLGQYAEAAQYTGQALKFCRQAGDRAGEAHALANTGSCLLRQQHLDQAVNLLWQAIALARATGNRMVEATALTDLGLAELDQDRFAQAARTISKAVGLFRQIGERPGEATALNALAQVYLAQRDVELARSAWAEALRFASLIHDQYEQARAHDGLARAQLAAGEPGHEFHWQRALALFAELGVPEASQVRVCLTTQS